MDKETYLEEEVYFITDRAEDVIYIAVGEKGTVELSDKTDRSDKWVRSEKVCVNCESWNILDEKNDEYYCPICD